MNSYNMSVILNQMMISSDNNSEKLIRKQIYGNVGSLEIERITPISGM